MQFPSLATLALSLLIFVRLPEALLFDGPVSQPQAAAGDAETHYRNGMLLKQTGKSDEAVAEFEQAIESDPTFQSACDAMDEILSRRREWDRVIACWTRLIAAQPENAHAYCERGGAYSQKHDLANALSDGEKACSLGDQKCCQYVARLRQAVSSQTADQQPQGTGSRPPSADQQPQGTGSGPPWWAAVLVAAALWLLLRLARSRMRSDTTQRPDVLRLRMNQTMKRKRKELAQGLAVAAILFFLSLEYCSSPPARREREPYDLFVMVLVGLCIGAVLLKWAFWPSEGELLSEPEPLTEEEGVSEFQRRRSCFLRFGLLPAGVGFGVIFVGGALLTNAKFLGLPLFAVTFVAGLILIAWGSGYTFEKYKCPMCDETPQTSRGGVPINPDTCPSCGARLR